MAKINEQHGTMTRISACRQRAVFTKKFLLLKELRQLGKLRYFLNGSLSYLPVSRSNFPIGQN